MNTATSLLTRAQISCHGRRVAKRSANRLRKLEDAYAHGRFRGHPEEALESIARTREHLKLAREQASAGKVIDFSDVIALDEWLLKHLEEQLAAGRFRGTENAHRTEIVAVQARIELMKKGLA